MEIRDREEIIYNIWGVGSLIIATIWYSQMPFGNLLYSISFFIMGTIFAFVSLWYQIQISKINKERFKKAMRKLIDFLDKKDKPKKKGKNG